MNRFEATIACPICGAPGPSHWAGEQPWMCSAGCYRAYFERVHPPAAPSCHDTVTMTCPICQRSFTPLGRQKYCSDARKAAAYRRRRDATRPALTVPRARPRRPITVYECDNCGQRALGEQRCPDCHTFMRKVGLGGECPHCAEAVAVTELLDQEVIATD
jgi:hypothetical protein